MSGPIKFVWVIYFSSNWDSTYRASTVSKIHLNITQYLGTWNYQQTIFKKNFFKCLIFSQNFLKISLNSPQILEDFFHKFIRIYRKFSQISNISPKFYKNIGQFHEFSQNFSKSSNFCELCITFSTICLAKSNSAYRAEILHNFSMTIDMSPYEFWFHHAPPPPVKYISLFWKKKSSLPISTHSRRKIFLLRILHPIKTNGTDKFWRGIVQNWGWGGW